MVPAEAFEIVLNVASLGIISTWAMIVLCQMQLARLAARGELLPARPSGCSAPPTRAGSPWSSSPAVLVLMAFDYPVGTWTVASLVVIIPLLMLGWFLCRHRILAIAAVRDGFTGPYPLVANRPGREQRSEHRRGFGVTPRRSVPRNATSPQPLLHRGSHMLSGPDSAWLSDEPPGRQLMTNWRIRDFHSADLDGILHLWESLKATNVEPVYALSEVLASCEKDHAVVAVQGEQVVGAAVGRAAHDQGWIVFLATLPEFRGRGIGTSLLAAVENRMAPHGLNKLSALMPESETRVEAFLGRGFALKKNLRYFERTIPVQRQELGAA